MMRKLSQAASVLAVVPARFASQRFPGKLLYDLCGKPVVVRTVQAAQRATSLSEIWVATDDERIGKAVADMCPSARVVYTEPTCPSGSDRLVEALRSQGLLPQTTCIGKGSLESFPFQAIVNVQGDEPLLNPSHIDSAVKGLLESPEADVSTLVHRLDTSTESGRQRAANRNVVKCVMDSRNFALYFSRALIPDSPLGHVDETGKTPYYKHIGLYAYRPEALIDFVESGPSQLEQHESLEQLRALELGMRIKVIEVGDAATGIDTEDQLEEARALFLDARDERRE